MTDLIERPSTETEPVVPDHGDHDSHGLDHHEHHGQTGILKWLTSTDHKVIGVN